MAPRAPLFLALLALSVGVAHAEPLWDKVQNPRIAEVRRLTREADELSQAAANIYEPHLRILAQRLRRAAAEKLCRAADFSPDDIQLLLRCGQLSRLGEDYVPASLAFSRVLRLDSKAMSAKDHQDHAAALLVLGRLDDAALAVGRGLALQRGGDADVFALRPTLALIRMADGRLDEAADQLELAAVGTSGDACLQHLLAVVYDRDEQVVRAAEALDRASSVDSTFSHLTGIGGCSFDPLYGAPTERHYFLALAYERQGQLADAAEAWRAYLGSSRPRYAGRARAHLAEIAKKLDGPPLSGGVVGGGLP